MASKILRTIVLATSVWTSWSDCPVAGQCDSDGVQTGSLLQKQHMKHAMVTENLQEEEDLHLEKGDRSHSEESRVGCPEFQGLPFSTPGLDVDALGLSQGGSAEPSDLSGPEPLPPSMTTQQSEADDVEDVDLPPALSETTVQRVSDNVKDILKHHPMRKREEPKLMEMHHGRADEAFLSAVSPSAGSTAGGTTVTVWGSSLYMPHSKMDAGGGSSPSALQPSVRVFLGTIECVVESFESRPTAVKCVTPALETDTMKFTDVDLPVTVMKLMGNGSYVNVPLEGSVQPTFKYSSAATPELVSVMPQVSGPGDVLRIHAWSCSGVVEAEPMELVKVDSTENATGQGADRDGTVNELVDDPAEGWGAVCEAFPPHGVRDELQRATRLDADQMFTSAEGGPESVGAKGLYGVYFKDPDPDVQTHSLESIKGMQEFLENNNVASAYRYFIAPTPNLPWESFWTETRASYFVVMDGWLFIEHPGAYKFYLRCEDRCMAKVGEYTLTDKSSGRQTARWHNNQITTDNIEFTAGWQRIKIIHVNILNSGGGSGMRMEYNGPPTDGWQVIPETFLRAGVSQATVDGLNRDADRQRVGRSPQSLTPAKRVHSGGRANGAKCPGDESPMLVEFFCKVPKEMQPGFYNLKFHDYHYGQSVEAKSSLWDMGMGRKRASVRVAPKITSVEEHAGGLYVTGMGLDELPIMTSGGKAQYGDVEYEAKNGTQDYIELVPSGTRSNASIPASGTTSTLGARGLLREFWFRNSWPEELEALGETPSIARSSELITPIEDANGAAAGFSERLSGVLVPPMTSECRFRVQGTRKHSSDTQNDARVYLSSQPLSVLSAGGAGAARPVPAMYWPGQTFTGKQSEPVDLTLSGYEGYFAGGFSLAAKIKFAAHSTVGTVFEFGHMNGNRIALHYDDNRLSLYVCHGLSCSSTYCDNKMDRGTEHEWMFGVSSLNTMVIYRDNERVSRKLDGKAVASQSRPYLHMWMGRGITDIKRMFVGEIKAVKIFNTLAHWNDAYGPEVREPPATPISTIRKTPYFELGDAIGENAPSDQDPDQSPTTKLSTFDENNFYDRGSVNEDQIWGKYHGYDLSNGYPVILYGWTHSRWWTKGYMRNQGGPAYAEISRLVPGANYTYKLYQYARHYGGTSTISINGGPEFETNQKNSLDPTKEGTATANADGKIIFKMVKKSAYYLHLSAIALAGPPPTGKLGSAVQPVDIADMGLGPIGGSMSIAFTARWDAPMVTGTPIIDFGNAASDSIIVRLSKGSGLEFCVTTNCVSAGDLVEPNKESSFLVSINDYGDMFIYKDSVLVAESPGSTSRLPASVDRFHMWVGKSNLPEGATHVGQIKNVKIFKGSAQWKDAFAADALSAPPLPPVSPVAPLFMYAGKTFSGNDTDVVDASGQYDQRTGGGLSVSFTARVDTAGGELMKLGSLENEGNTLTVSTDGAGSLEFTTTRPGHRRRRRRTSPVEAKVTTSLAVGEESEILCTVTQSGQMAIYKDGTQTVSSNSGQAPGILAQPLVFGTGFKGLLKNVKIFDQFLRWRQAFPTKQNGTSLLQLNSYQTHWHRLEMEERAARSKLAATTGTVADVNFLYGNPIVYTDWANERVSDWKMLQQGEEYPFRIERKLAGKSANTGASGWKQLGLECRSLQGHEEMLPRRSEVVSMDFKQFPVQMTLPAWPAGYQLSFRGQTVDVTNDAEVGPKLYSLFEAKCSVQPPVDGTSVKLLSSWESSADKKPTSEAYCGLGAKAPALRRDGTWEAQLETLSTEKFMLRESPFLTMCFKLEPGAAVNMVVRCKVGSRNREQWFSIGMTLPNPDSFEYDYKRAAQWPLQDANGSHWQCPSFNLMDQIMSFSDYERRFRDVNYNNLDASHLSNMEILGIYLGTPIKSGGAWKHLTGGITVDQFMVSTTQLTVTQSAPSPLSTLPFSNVAGLVTARAWFCRYFSGYSSYGNLNPTQKPFLESFEEKVSHNFGYGGPPGYESKGDQWVLIATGTVMFEAGKYQFGISVDDETKVFIDGKQVAHRRCCTGWDKFGWSSAVDVTAGKHEVQIHFKEVGGLGYNSVKWRKEGDSTEHAEIPAGTGVSDSHSIDFVPSSRTDQTALKALLEEVTVSYNAATDGATAPNGLSITLPDGTPNEMVTAKLLPPPGQWVPAVVVTGTGLDKALDVGNATFNRLFGKCPVVRYRRNGQTDSVYVRTSAIPDGFNAYSIFATTWSSAGNTLGTDMQIYPTEDDARQGKNGWNYCNYDFEGVGYPRDCGPTGFRGDRWFGLPEHGGGDGLWAGASLEIYDGDDCPSDAVAGPDLTSITATFSMGANSSEVLKALKEAGFPDMDYRVMGLGGKRYLDLTSQPATMPTVSSSRWPTLATDGHLTTAHDKCSTTESQSNPWFTVQLGGTYSVDSIRVLSRSGDGARYLSDLSVTVDGRVCASGVSVGNGEFTEIPCPGAYGSSLTITRAVHDHLVICELEVAVRDASVSSGERSDYSAMISSAVPGDSGMRISLSSPMALATSASVLSSGTRFWKHLTDFWFRMPYQTKQVSFGDWRDYICGTELATGCSPVAASPGSHALIQPSMLQASRHRHPAFLARPPHTPDAGEHAATLGRRHPQRRWRLPARVHSHESLEAMRRAVFGYAKKPKGWAETSALLQAHAGHQKRFRSRETDWQGQDPRSDPNALAWSSPDSWGGEQPPNFDTADIVYLPEGKTALLDMDVYIRFWVIEGNLVWSQDHDLHMQAEAVVVNGGQLLIGSEDNPYAKLGQLTFHGDWHSFKLPLFGSKGIFEPRGNIEMHGSPVADTWNELETTAYPGDTTITLRKAVDWKAGDLIVVAATDRSLKDCRLDRRDYCQVEERHVVENDGNGKITLSKPLVYRHVAQELDPKFSAEVCAEDPSICTPTQVRAEVGLLTRNLKVRGANPVDGSGPAGSEGYGAHIMMAERGQFEYVQFFWMGQSFQMGRYPLHYHLTGLNPTSYIKGCSLQNTFQRGVTVHGTHQAVVKDNVLYNHLAHGFFIEDGNEHDNVFENNLGMMGHVSLSMLNSDQTPATFWIRNPSNYFRNNHAAGCASFGFWFDTLDQAAPTLQREFSGNTAHSNGDTGVWVDIVDSREACVSPDGWTVDVPFRNTDEVSQPVHTNAPDCEHSKRVNFAFKSTTTWGNDESGIVLFETGHLHVLNHRSVSEPIGCKVWGIQSDNFPDVTNDWYGPVVRNSAYHSESELTTAGFAVDCSVKTPWDDTLFLSGLSFIGPVTSGHICPCAECMVVGEGGYQVRTSKLSWHENAGTPASPKAFFPWQFISYFFDYDGSLTEDVSECQQYGCYLHSPFTAGGTYSQREDAPGSSLLATQTSRKAAKAACMDSMVGETSNPLIPNAQITYSTSWSNSATYQKVRMDETKWCVGTQDANQWVQFDFGEEKFVSAIQTKGRSDYNSWVKTYKVSYSMDGNVWKQLERVFPGNRDRHTVMENRVSPFLARFVRLEPKSWQHHACMRAEILGCSGSTGNFSSTCFDRAYLDDSYRNCRDIERSYNNDQSAMAADFCSKKGQYAKNTVLTANQACCACGGGNIVYNINTSDPNAVTPPEGAPVTSMPSGTGYLDPKRCRNIDNAGGVVCSRSARMQTVTLKDAGIWHQMMPMDVQSDYGWAEMGWTACYRQYEFTVLGDMRHAMMPPLAPNKMHDWDYMSGHITMRKGDRYFIQIETLHNPDGYTVRMPGVTKTAEIDSAPVKYDANFFTNETLLGKLSRETTGLSAARKGLSLSYDMYKVAHEPVLDTAFQEGSAANWGYLPANASDDMSQWYPGMFTFMISDSGVVSGANHFGAWNGLRRDPTEQMVTRPLASEGGAEFGFSHVHTSFAWSRWNKDDPSGGNGAPADGNTATRLEYLVKYCGMNPALFKHLGPDAEAALAAHPATAADNPSAIAVGDILRFSWSSWPAEAGEKPGPNGNVTIQSNWEVTLDEDVDLNQLDVSGVLKFADVAGCCKLSATYIMVGAYVGRLEAGTSASPITVGKAHIVLKGTPLTPELPSFRPHIRSSAKWMKNKFLAVQGRLSLFGAPRSSIWSKIAMSVQAGDTTIELEGGEFKVGDVVTIDRGQETRTLTAVEAVGSGVRITFDEALQNSYLGADHVHLGKQETAGLMASYVGLIEGHTVVVEGEDTPGAPMCDKNETHKCPYSSGMPRGVNLADFAKEIAASGEGSHPNCKPCGACSGMDYSGYIMAMAHFHQHYDRCPKDHGVVEASSVSFIHGSSIHFYHDYSGGNYPHDTPKNFAGAWSRRPNSWWEDPIWAEFNLPMPVTPTHKVKQSTFNNQKCGSALALATSGVYTVPMETVEGNVFLTAGVGLNAASRSIRTDKLYMVDTASPSDDNAATRTMGVGSPSDDLNPAKLEKFVNPSKPKWTFVGNFLSGAPLISLAGSTTTGNVFLGPVKLEGSDLSNGKASAFRSNVVSAPTSPYCISMMTEGTQGIADNVVHSCRTAIGFRGVKIQNGIVKGLKLLNADLGIGYTTKGPDMKKHDATKVSFKVEDTKIYAKADGSGVGMYNPKVSSGPLGEPGAPDWWNAGPPSDPLGHAVPSLYFHTEIRRCQFAGYQRAKKGVGLVWGELSPADVADADYYPIMIAGTSFVDMQEDAYLRFGLTSGAGPELRQCLQIDCDGRRNSLLIDVDGSVLGSPGTVIPRPQKFYDKMTYADPHGATTMEDLIPMTQRYDKDGQAIPFPAGVGHGSGGGLEYECEAGSTQEGGAAGCDVLFTGEEGEHVTKADVPGFAPGAKITALKADGDYVRIDALHHGWTYTGGFVRKADVKLTQSFEDALKPESQHARRYGRVAPGAFGSHPNTSRSQKGPVYTVPGIWRDGCTENKLWRAYTCPGGQHRHLAIEVMDWNFIDRRVAPVTVEVNDQYAPSGGAMNVLTGPAMMMPEKRVQIFHALGHVGLRHNIYFTANPPSHLRIHFQYAPPETGVIVCIYYGVPNMVYAYVNGAKKEPLANATTGYDNMVLTRLTPDMPHGTHFYDRVGVETGKPGYLYAVVRGGQSVDFKISHKVQLTTKITVSGDWGGWNNAGGDNFFNKGLDGLVRNIALLIGAPPNRVKILGEGSAAKGTFWNEDTTSKEFAEHMWKQNKSLDGDVDSFIGSSSSKSGAALAQHEHRRASLLQSFSSSRQHLLSAALADSSTGMGRAMAKLTSEERRAVMELRAQRVIAKAAEDGMDNILKVQQLAAQRAKLGSPCSNTNGEPCPLPIALTVDDEDYTPASAKPVGAEAVKDAVAIAEDENNQAEVKIEGQADNMFNAWGGSNNVTGLLQLVGRDDTTYPVLNAKVDDVPHMTAPLGWRCAAEWYGDGAQCHCDCGVWDPDCDTGSETVPATSGVETINLLDKQQVAVLMNLLDADGDANGVLNGNEILGLDSRLGQSALLGVAKRIVDAQEKGENKKSAIAGAMRLGYFAMLEAKETGECSHLLVDGPPLDPELATFRTMCVRDSEFDTVVSQPTGRCSLLPEMKAGSQCMVPANVGFKGAVKSRSNDTSDSNAYVPSPEAVCGSAGRIYSGAGVGGHRSSGVGISSAKWTNPGAEFLPGTDTAVLDMNALGLQKLDSAFRGGWSFYGVLRIDRREDYMAVLSFGRDRGSAWEANRLPHIVVRTRKGSSPETISLELHIGFSSSDWRREVTVSNVLKIGEEAGLLFTLTNEGKVEIYKKGILLIENDFRTGKMVEAPFPNMWIAGGSAGKCNYRSCHDKYGYEGLIGDIRIWDSAVTWNEAVAGVPEGSTPIDDGEEEPEGDLPAACVASRKNTWDFVCDDKLPDELLEDFGFNGVVDPKAKDNFEKRENAGEITVCGQSNQVKASIFHGSFGDGITGEYFRVRPGCGPPFLFGQVPKLIRIDPVIDFEDNLGFRSPHNEYAVRWSGKVLIETTGSYTFKLSSKDGSWLAVGGQLVVDNSGCHGFQEREGTITLDKGGLSISVLFFNKGPQGAATGTIKLLYKGPDTKDRYIKVPQEKLASAPLRLSRLGRDTNETSNKTEDVRMGYFTYDEDTRLGIMPKGSCDVACRRGERKAGAAPFKFFCSEPTTVSFVATVNKEAGQAMLWVDQSPVNSWELFASPSLVQTSSLPIREEVLLQQAKAQNTTATVLLSMAAGGADQFIMMPSSPSPDMAVTAGEHSLFFQGRPGDDEAFAFGGLRVDKGVEKCVFFLEGSDKLPDDC